MKIAVIGSRDTPVRYNRLLFGLVTHWSYFHTIRSGRCKKGPDDVVNVVLEQALIENRKPSILIYPPREVHRGAYDYDYCHYGNPDLEEVRREIIRGLHPYPDALKEDHYPLHCRNISIISGVNMDDNVDMVVYAHKSKVVKGGTAMGVNYAKGLDIPTFNIIHDPLDVIITKTLPG